MKKIVGIIAAAALATAAFAEINVSSWNRAVFEPFHYDGDTLRSETGPSWGVGDGGACRSGLSFSASTENAGINIDINAEGGVGTGDNALVWVKPVDMLTIKFGQIDNNFGRLDHGFGTWDRSRFGFADAFYGEGLAEIVRKKGVGANFSLTPVEGLVIDYEANFNQWENNVKVSDNHSYDTLWESSSTLIGYKADFGFIRAIINGEQAAYYSVKDTDTKPAASIALAADITAVENLVLKFGVKVPTVLKSANSRINGAVAADYNLDALALHANAILSVGPKKTNDDGDYELGNIGAAFGLGVDYAFSDAWKLITDVRFKTWTHENTDDLKDIKLEDPAFGAYIGLQQQLTNASFDFGVQFGKRALKNAAAGKEDEFQFAVPLTITASF